MEDRDGELLSFFHGEGRHAVTQAKERLVERPQGHLLYSGAGLWPEPDVLGTTVYAAGIFNAQVFLGNTNLARFLSVVRNALNVVRASGQRVFVRLDDRWRQLGAPSVFDLGPNDARWIYDLGDRVIEARTACQPDRPAVTLELRVLRGEPVEWLVTHHLALGADELTMPQPLVIDTAGGAIGCLAASDGLLARSRPGTGLAIVVDAPESVAQLGGGELLGGGEDRAPVPFAVVQVRAVAQCAITLAPFFEDGPPLGSRARELRDARKDRATEQDRPTRPLADLKLAHPHDAGVARIDEVVPWFAHNAAVHLVVPHGLEQYGGAAWGVRDVCQGPVEWLLAARRYPEVRRILLDVFAQQYEDDEAGRNGICTRPSRSSASGTRTATFPSGRSSAVRLHRGRERFLHSRRDGALPSRGRAPRASGRTSRCCATPTA